MSRIPVAMLALGALVAVAGGCGGSSGHSASTSTTRGYAAPVTPTTAASSTTSAPPAQQVTVTPASGLHDGQTVQVQATGFKPAEALAVTQCKDDASGPADCSSIQTTTSNASGDVSTTYVVHQGPFGENQVVCSPTQACVIGVNELSLTGAGGSAPITFAP